MRREMKRDEKYFRSWNVCVTILSKLTRVKWPNGYIEMTEISLNSQKLKLWAKERSCEKICWEKLSVSTPSQRKLSPVPGYFWMAGISISQWKWLSEAIDSMKMKYYYNENEMKKMKCQWLLKEMSNK
jgi:hypothetical protein